MPVFKQRLVPLALGLLVLALPLLVIASIWAPYRHFYRGTPSLSALSIDASRVFPDNARLEMLAKREPLLALIPEAERDPIAFAQALLRGDTAFGSGLHAPVQPQDVAALPSAWQLAFYGLAPVRVYIRAFQTTGNTRYLEAARDYLLRFIAAERAAWKPEGLLWNDHALAQRAQILIEFWQTYRQSTIYRAEDAGKILGLAAKSAAMLADPALYTYRTNHGVMQNLALLQLRLAFPKIDRFDGLGELAFSRLETQIPHYLNPEGVILEHSAGYQAFGVALLEASFADLRLLGLTVPSEWDARLAKAQAVNKAMHHCDGTLPRWGDTDAQPMPGMAPQTGPAKGSLSAGGVTATLLPAAGLAIWADEAASCRTECCGSDALFTWSYYPGLGHKHADDLGFFLRSGQQDWWSAEGYLADPPASSRIGSAWDGANAPHLIDEDEHSPRHDRLLGFGIKPGLVVADAERISELGQGFRRQIIQAGLEAWIIVDSGVGQHVSRTAWILDPSVSMPQPVGAHAYRMTGPASPDAFDVTFLGGGSLSLIRGQLSPMLGWVDEGHRAVPTHVLLADRGPNEPWAMNVSQLAKSGEPPRLAHLRDWRDPEHWSVEFGQGGQSLVERSGQSISMKAPGQSESLILPPPTDVAGPVAAIGIALRQDATHYGAPVRDLWEYRTRMTVWLGALALSEFAVLLLLGWFSRRLARAAQALSLVFWCGTAAYLWLIYF